MDSILILNMGLKSIRSIVFDMNGNKLSSASLPLETYLKGNEVTQNPCEWWEKGKIVIKQSVADKQIRDTVKYMTVTTSAACLIAVDEYGNNLESAIMVSDKRAAQESRDIENCSEFNKVKDLTKLKMDPYLMLPKVLWIKKNWAEIYDKTKWFLSPNDYLTHKITGEIVTDTFNAQKYHYSIEQKTYPIELLKQIGIPLSTLPNVVDVGTEIGCVCKSFADEFAINKDAKFVITTYDAVCAFFGSGTTQEGEACDVSGTVTSFRCLTYNMNLVPTHNMMNTPFLHWNLQLIGGSNNLGGGLIEWVKQCYYQNEKYPYEVMESDANESTVGAGGLIFLPYLLGERAPIWNADARGVFFGLERTHTRREMTRAVFESAGFAVCDMIDEIGKSGLEVKRIRVSGGLARIPLVSQIKADVTGKDILVVSEFETTALGAVILALVGVGVFSSLEEASVRLVSIRTIIKPDKRNHQKYLEVHKLYKDTYETLLDLFVARNKMVHKIYRDTESHVENL